MCSIRFKSILFWRHFAVVEFSEGLDCTVCPPLHYLLTCFTTIYLVTCCNLPYTFPLLCPFTFSNIFFMFSSVNYSKTSVCFCQRFTYQCIIDCLHHQSALLPILLGITLFIIFTTQVFKDFFLPLPGPIYSPPPTPTSHLPTMLCCFMILVRDYSLFSYFIPPTPPTALSFFLQEQVFWFVYSSCTLQTITLRVKCKLPTVGVHTGVQVLFHFMHLYKHQIIDDIVALIAFRKGLAPVTCGLFFCSPYMQTFCVKQCVSLQQLHQSKCLVSCPVRSLPYCLDVSVHSEHLSEQVFGTVPHKETFVQPSPLPACVFIVNTSLSRCLVPCPIHVVFPAAWMCSL